MVPCGGLWIPEMRPFRQHPSFQTLVDALNMTEYWREFGPPDACELRDGRIVC